MNTMQSRTGFGFALLLSAFAFSAVGEEGKIDPPRERLKTLGQKIQSGNWAEASDYAKSQLQSSEKQAVEKYVLDVANDVLNQPRKQLLSEYDFPYSDKNALKEVQAWVNGLLKTESANADVLILNAMLFGPKALNNASEFAAVLEKASKIAPTNAFIQTALGSAYGAQGKILLAVETLQKAISLDDKSSSAHLNLGVALLKKGETSRAVKEMEKATELDEANPFAWFNLGSYHAERNNTSEARRALEKTIELDPKLLEARWNLGGIYFNSGQQSKAVDQLREIIKIGPNSTMGKQASQMLRQLGK
jgi:Flp pilus assembly protein TadD